MDKNFFVIDGGARRGGQVTSLENLLEQLNPQTNIDYCYSDIVINSYGEVFRLFRSRQYHNPYIILNGLSSLKIFIIAFVFFPSAKYIFWQHSSILQLSRWKIIPYFILILFISKIGVVNLVDETVLPFWMRKLLSFKLSPPLLSRRTISDLSSLRQEDTYGNSLLMVGEINENKGQIRLLNLYPKRDLLYRLEILHIFGSCDDVTREKLNSSIANTKISEKVIYHGEVTNKKEIYSGKSFLLVNSIHEGYPLVVVEALLAGLTIIIRKTCLPKSMHSRFEDFIIIFEDDDELYSLFKLLKSKTRVDIGSSKVLKIVLRNQKKTLNNFKRALNYC